MKKLIYLLLFLLVVSPALAADQDTTTQRELRGLVRNYLGGNATSSFWTDGVIDDFVNLACREYALLGGISKMDTVSTTTGTDEYGLNSDFLRIRGVTRYDGSTKRERALLYRSIRAMDGKAKALGEDEDRSHPEFYTISGAGLNKGHYLIIDPSEEESDRDTLFIYYYAQAIELDTAGGDTITDVHYAGVNFVVMSAVKSCLLMNREDPTCGLAVPWVDKMYQTYYDLLVREQSDMEWRPTQ